ncbi:MAG: hypothetical protein HYX69_12460 [Planctomycetia bacterium]|nr:hypothetical protein [Planctomycetia bacterium]
MNKAENKKSDDGAPGVFENLGRKLDHRPEVQAAEEALRQARTQFERAQEYCESVRQQATDGLHRLRDRNVGDVVSGTLEWVRKHPGTGVLSAVLCGFFLGKIFKR